MLRASRPTAMRPLALALLAAALALPTLLVPAAAQTTPAAPQRAGAALPSDQPYASYWYPNTLLDWSPASDPDAAYNRSGVPLRPRFDVSGLQATAHARPGEARVNPLSAFAPTSGNPAQGSLDAHYYAFGYWPYTDLLVFWGGSAGEGLILAPNPGVTDAAHRHGTAVLGTVFFPPTVFGGQIQWVRDFVQREGDTFPVADKLIEVAEHYGFDGWFINQETAGGDAALATDLQDLMLYLQAHSDLQVEWYDAMTESGSIFWQEQLNAQNDAFFQQGDQRVADAMFLDFGWTTAELAASNAYAVSLGRDPYDLYAGVDYQARGLGIASDMPRVFPEGQAHQTSLGIYRPDETLGASLDAFFQNERALWVGADGDPSRSSAGWNGIAHYVPAATSIDGYFWTDFDPGHGFGYFRDGEDLAPPTWADGWNNLSLQSLQPTWRWWVESAGPPVAVGYDFETAYEGPASVRLQGDASTTQTVHLFEMRQLVQPSSALALAVRQPAAGAIPLDVGLRFADAPGVLERRALGNGPAGWTDAGVSLAGDAGRELIEIALVVPAVGAVDLHVDRMRILVPGSPAPSAPTAVTVERRTEEAPAFLTLRLRWEAPPQGVDRYEVYRSLPGGGREFVGGASTTAYFVPELRRLDGQDEITVEIVAVGLDGARSEPGTVTVLSVEPPIAAASPAPAPGALGVPTGARLTWAPAPGATSRTVRFGPGTDPPVVATGFEGAVYAPGPLQPGTAYSWRVDETNAAGTTVGPLWTFTTGTDAGPGDAALRFDGADDVVDLGQGDAVDVTGTAITLEARIRPSAWRDGVFEGNVVNKEENGPDDGYALRVGDDGRFNFLLGGGGWREVTTAPGTLALDVWQHLAATYDGTTQRLYVDGVEVATGTASFSIASADVPLRVGSSARYPARTFAGEIDEVRVWSVARTAAQIQDALGRPLSDAETAPGSGLAGYWRFDEGAGQIAVDDAPAAAHGTLGLAAAVAADDPVWTTPLPVDAEAGAPGAFALLPAAPNPSGAATTLRFTLPAGGDVRLDVFDLLGRRVVTVLDEARAAGGHAVRLDTSRLPSGVYLARLTAGDRTATQRLAVVR